ncbi:MAG: transglutaminase family protein [Candidatus Thermoplasmatota archaeon]|nr:transglutaminase family protein [Candidatus Thermoplasmatota archaeon]
MVKGNNAVWVGSAVLVIVCLFFSGCEVMFPPTTYQSTPTKIRYTISYGYEVDCSGTGRYSIAYHCNPPELLLGSTTYSLLYNDDVSTTTSLGNTFLEWNISGEDERTYTLGVTAEVTAETLLVADLNGQNARTLGELQEQYPTLVAQYTQLQGNDTTRFIDPADPSITAIAQSVKAEAGTNNSFLLAQSLFTWFKQHMQYQTHPGQEGVQPAVITFETGSGDCDDLSFLYISLCRSVSLPARFIRGYLLTAYANGTVSAIPHAWVEVCVGGSLGNNGWIPIECSCSSASIAADIHQNFGVEDAYHLRLFVDNGSNESLTRSLSEISYITYGGNRDILLHPFVDVEHYEELEEHNLVVTQDDVRQYE